jgi:imidazoleglycerol phosphate synthase glutamine amidotransferase subunit HisH
MIKNIGDINHLTSHFDKKRHTYNKNLIITRPFKIKKNRYFFNHFDYIQKIPNNWISVIKNKNQIWMAYDKINKHIGIQFHPEVYKKSGRIFYKKWIKYII